MYSLGYVLEKSLQQIWLPTKNAPKKERFFIMLLKAVVAYLSLSHFTSLEG